MLRPDIYPLRPELLPNERSQCMRHTIEYLPGSLTSLGGNIESRYLGLATSTDQPWEIPLYPEVSERLQVERVGLRDASDDQLEVAASSQVHSYVELKETWGLQVLGYALVVNLVETLPAAEARRRLPDAPTNWFNAGEFRAPYDKLTSDIFTNQAGEPVLLRYKEGPEGSALFDAINLDRLHEVNSEILPWLIVDFHQQQVSANLRLGMQRNLLLHEMSPADLFPSFVRDLVRLAPQEQERMLQAIKVYTSRMLQAEPMLATNLSDLIEEVKKPIYAAPDVLAATTDILDHHLVCPAIDPADRLQNENLKRVVDAVSGLGQEESDEMQGALAYIGEHPYRHTEHHYEAAQKVWQSELDRQRVLLDFIAAARMANDQGEVFQALARHWPEAEHQIREFQGWLGPDLQEERVLLEKLLDEIVKDVWLAFDQPLSRKLILKTITEKAQTAITNRSPRSMAQLGSSPYQGFAQAHINAALEMTVLVRLRNQALEAENNALRTGLKPFKSVAGVQDLIDSVWQAQRQEVNRIIRYVRELPFYRQQSQRLVAKTGLNAEDIDRLLAIATPPNETDANEVHEPTFRALFHALVLERAGILPSVRHPAFISFLQAFLYRGTTPSHAETA